MGITKYRTMTSIEYDQAPEEVKAIIDTFDEDQDPYAECKRIQGELKQIGWICDYDLSGEIVELQKTQKQ